MTSSPSQAHPWYGPRLFNPGTRINAIAGALAAGLLCLFSSAARAETDIAHSAPNYFWSNGKKCQLTPSAQWSGVQLQAGVSAAKVAARAATRSGVDAARQALTYPRQNIVLVPLSAKSKPAARLNATRKLRAQRGVSHAVRVFDNESYKYPIVETDEFLIQFKPNVSQMAAAALLAGVGAELVQPLGSYAPNGYIARVTDASRTSTGVADALYGKPEVIFSHPNYVWPMQPCFAPNDPLYPQQWHLHNTGQGNGTAGADIKAEQAWNITLGSPNVVVAVVDDAVDVDHEDLLGRTVPGFNEIDKNGDPRPNTNFREYHGTAIAGLIAATGNNGIGVSGVAPNCKIMPIRLVTFGQTIQDTADAFRFATDNGADIINNSWGPANTTFLLNSLPDVIRSSIDYAVTRGRGGKGCVVLFSVGNFGGFQSADQNPLSSYDKVIAVAASTNQDLHPFYSATGQSVDIAAPANGGTLGLETTDISGALGYDPSNYTSTFDTIRGFFAGGDGTSAACAISSGVAALVLSVNPNLTYTQVRDILENSADKIDPTNANYDVSGHSNLYGYGRVNAFNAVQAALLPLTAVSLLAPAENDTVGGNYLLRATTNNDPAVRRVDFARRQSGTDVSFTRSPALPIPDTGIVFDSQVLQQSGTVDQAIITLDISHANPTDLIVTLIAPDGSRTVVYNQDPRFVVFTGTGLGIQLSQPVALQGKPIAGTWRLEVDDTLFDLANGTLNSWGLSFTSPWIPIGTASAPDPTTGEWRAIWTTGTNTSTPPGVYDVRATAITGTANAEAISHNVTVTPLGITLFAPTDSQTVSGSYIMRARSTNDAIISHVDFQRRRPAFTVSHNVNQPLLDGQTTSDSILVSGQQGTVGEAQVTVNIHHTFVGDLRVSVVSPNHQRVVLWDNQGGSQHDIITTFFNVPLAGAPMNGTWTLEVEDGQAIDEGTFISWGLKLFPQWVLIARDSSGAKSGEWDGIWNADITPPGIYDVRALAVSSNGNAFDINTNIKVVSRTFTLSGRVTSLTGAAMQNVTVTLSDVTGVAATQSVKTDGSGQYSFSGVAPGTYTVTPVLARNSFTPPSRTVTVTSGGTTGINFQQRAPDRIAPALTVTAPAAAPSNNYATLTAATGTASDDPGGSGLAQVTGLLFRYANGSTPAGYWNGTTFTTSYTGANEVPTSVGTTGSTSWRLAFPTLAQGTYYFRASATDRAGNVTRSPNLIFTVDRTPPTVRVVSPGAAPNNTFTALAKASGTATDNVGGSGLAKVTVLLYRYPATGVTAGFWNGSSWSPAYNAASQERAATGTTSWSIVLPALAPGRYYVRAAAQDKVGNTGRSASVLFVIKAATTRAVPSVSDVKLSTAAFAAATGSIQLHFTGALDAAAAGDSGHYTVSVNGQSVSVDSAAYAVASGIVTLALPDGALAGGDAVSVAWSGLADSRGQAVPDGSTTVR